MTLYLMRIRKGSNHKARFKQWPITDIDAQTIVNPIEGLSVSSFIKAMDDGKRVQSPTGSVFLLEKIST